MIDSHQSYRSYLNNNIFLNVVAANESDPQRITLGNLPIMFKYGKKHSKSDFIVRPMKFDCALVRKHSSTIEAILEKEDCPEFALCKIYEIFRDRYEETSEQLSLQLSQLALKLVFYLRMQPEKGMHLLIKPVQYLTLSLNYGSSFTTFVKKLRAYATLSTLGHTRFLDLEEKIKELNENNFNIILDMDRKFSYDDFLQESHLLFWEEEINDFEYSFKELEFKDEAVYETFRLLIRELLTTYKVNNIHSPDNSDIATWTSDSTSFDDDEDSTLTHKTIVRQRIYAKRKDCFGHLTNEMRFRRTIIPVGPGNWRDSWMPDLDTLFTIKSISHLMRQVVQPIPYSAMYDAQIAHKRKKILRKEGNLFFLLDFKKSGLTINRKLLTVMGEELESVYPDVEAFRYIKYYDDLKVHHDGKTSTPPRGIGLGNANELYTLMQCAIGLMVNKVYKTGSIFFNDDAVYVMHPNKWRSQLVQILSFIKAIGLIPNLGKSIVSKSNIFCEEYQIFTGEDEEVVDYSKRQLLVLPLASVLFQRTTAAAKRYLFSIDRQLIGTGYRHLTADILNYTKDVYKNEFGKMDYLLPYHLGGWVDFSTSNFSCLVEYMIDPWKYLQEPSHEGQIPEIRRWILYNLDVQNKDEKSILGCRSKISYRSKLKLPFDTGLLFDYKTDLNSYVHQYLGLMTPDIYNENLGNVINYRGLHNAKPKIRSGLDHKEKNRRKAIFTYYKSWKKDHHLSIRKDGLSLSIILESIKDVPDAPSYYRYPSCLVTKSIPFLQYPSEKKAIVVKKKMHYQHGSSKMLRTVNNTVRSIESKIWLHGSDPFILFDLLQRVKSGYLISDKVLNLKSKIAPKVPPHYDAFSPNKKLLLIDFITANDIIPIEYQAFNLIPSEFEDFFLLDAFDHILPTDLKGRWRRLKHNYSSRFSDIRDIIENINLTNRKEFVGFITTLEEILGEGFVQEREVLYYEDLGEDISNLIRRIEEEELYLKIIEKDYSIEALLDEHADDIYSSDYLSDQYSESSRDYDGLDSDIGSPILSGSNSDISFSYQEEEDNPTEEEYKDSSSEYDASSEDGSSDDEFIEELISREIANELVIENTDPDTTPMDEFSLQAELNSGLHGNLPMFSKKGVGRSEFRRLRFNPLTDEVLVMSNIYDRMEYARMRRRSNKLPIFDQDSSGDETVLSLNEIRRLFREQSGVAPH